MLRLGRVTAFALLLFGTLLKYTSGQTVVYSNQANIENVAIGFSPLPVIWDDLQLTGSGTLSEISLVTLHSDPNVRTASGFIDLRIFDEANNRPQGTPIGMIPFNGTYAPFAGNTDYTLISLSGLETLGLALPGTGRIGVGIQLDDEDWFFPGAGTPTVGSSPGDNWLDNSSFERRDATGDFAWRVVVAETSPLVKWDASSGMWDDPANWDTGSPPLPSQDVLVRSTGAVATVTGPASDVTVKSIQVGELAFSNTTLRLQPGTTLTATESFLIAINGFLDLNGGRLVTGDFGGQPNLVFNAGTIEVHGGTFSPTPFDFTLSGIGNPTVILDDALFNVGFGATREDLLIANTISHRGSLTARDGSTLTAANVVVGGPRGTQGELILSGPGTTMDVSTKLTLGQNPGTNNDPARGTLRIENQAIATVAEMDIGQAGHGIATIDGGTLNVVQNGSNPRSGELRIGGLAPSSLTIENGGVVNARIVDIASITATTASVLVTGSGSLLNVTSGIAVGDSNEGKLRVLDGAHVTTGSLATGVGTGLAANEKNEIQIDGSDTRVTATGSIRADVGGEVTIMGGAQVTANTAAASGGTLRVSGPGTLVDTSVTTNTLASFGAPRGTARIENGAVVRSRGLEIATLGTAASSVVITGEGTRLETDGLFFVVGNVRPGSLDIEAGAVVERTGDVFVAASNTAPGDLTILGSGSRLDVEGDFYLSGGRLNGQVFSFTSVGMLNIQEGAVVDVAGTMEPFPSGQINLQGGSLIADEITLQSGGQFNFTAGRLAVDNFVGNLLNNGGTLAPGGSPGITDVSGLLDQNDGTLEIEIFAGGATPMPGVDFDQVLAGSVQLDGALQIIADEGYQPALGDTFQIIDAATSLSGQFASVLGADLGGGLVFDVIVDALARNVTLEVIQSATLDGDYNNDGRVDAADYVVWRKTDGTPAGYNAWRTNFGNTLGSGSAVAANEIVPEPASVVLALLGTMLLVSLPQARSSRPSHYQS
jgi:T5SS/PEP-CTERM-associated repeat protein